jgi:hypothetical protein
MKSFGSSLAVLLLALFVVVFAGCETLENGDDYDTKPWTDRESWENSMPGVPF